MRTIGEEFLCPFPSQSPIGEKYSKLPGIWTYDFYIVRHPTTNNVMIKVREQGFKDEFRDTYKKVVI